MIYWRLSGFYLCYFISLGALVPYWSLYLKSVGLSVTEIGELFAILMASKVIAPNVWGWIADHTGHRMTIVRIASLLAVLAFSGVYFSNHFWWLALVMSGFGFFWNAALPQFEATTMNHLGNETHRYSGIRLWGSVGFIIAVTSLGSVIDHYGAASLPVILSVVFVLIWLSSLAVPESAVGHLPLDQESLFSVLRRPEVFSLLLVCFLVQASHGPYYTFYTLYLEEYGYDTTQVGQLWALGVVAEIVLFLFMPRLLSRFSARHLLLVTVALTTLRWVLIAWLVQYPVMVVLAQTLHAASFGLYHAVAIHLVHRLFTGVHQGRGQALYSSVSFGAGGALGSIASGYLWADLGPRSMFMLAAATGLVGLAVVYAGIRAEPPAERNG
jgi:MFS transporter, PPP family, 3-phenylpropionic acid transporter